MGYKSLAQIPACRNRPVSYNVRPHISETASHNVRKYQKKALERCSFRFARRQERSQNEIEAPNSEDKCNWNR